MAVSPSSHGRIETRRIGCSSALNAYLDFPHVGQVFRIEREVLHKKSGKRTLECALGMTRRSPEQADPQRVLVTNRGHWVIDWNFDEDRCRIRSGYGPENITRLRRFAVGAIQCFSKGQSGVAATMRRLNRNTRLVFDTLRMTKNSTRTSWL